jgi:hypothetical protein
MPSYTLSDEPSPLRFVEKPPRLARSTKSTHAIKMWSNDLQVRAEIQDRLGEL